MGIPQYLAMTAAEIHLCPETPEHIAWLGCCFGETGLLGLPEDLPPGAILVLDDRTPMTDQSPQALAEQLASSLAAFDCRGLLLDFQRPGIPAQKALTEILVGRLPCPMAAPPEYAPESCAVFLPPVPIEQTAEEYLAPWARREIWLDTAPQDTMLHLSSRGCTIQRTNAEHPSRRFYDDTLCCRYSIQKEPDGFSFYLFRDGHSIQALLAKAEKLGVTLSIGLWQEMGGAT